jgi:APA family basic amino acid/polyamine antiporter
VSELKRSLGLPALTLYGLGTILGAGIYSVLGAAAGEAGTAVWMSFVISGAVAGLTALSYAELSTMEPDAGAEYALLARRKAQA